MAPPAAFPPSDFWDFALGLYGQEAVAEACLLLQDRHGADVNLLLLACWLARQGRVVDVATARRLRAIALDWQVPVIRPLREVRRLLKQRIGACALLPDLRRRLAELEIDFEHVTQLMLEQAVRTATFSAAAPGAAVAPLNAARLVPQVPQDSALLKTVIGAAYPARGS